MDGRGVDHANPQAEIIQQVSHLGQIQHGDSQIHPGHVNEWSL